MFKYLHVSFLVHVHIPFHSNPGNKTPSHSLPSHVFCKCYDLRPGILIKLPKGKDEWGSWEFTCPLWLYYYPVAPDLHSRFPSPHLIGIIKLRTTGVEARVWTHSGNWRIEQGGWSWWRVGGSCYWRCFPSYHRCRYVDLTPHPGLLGLLLQRELRNFQKKPWNWLASSLTWVREAALSPLRTEGRGRGSPIAQVDPFLLQLSLWALQRQGTTKSGPCAVRACNLDPLFQNPSLQKIRLPSPLHNMLLNCSFFPFPPIRLLWDRHTHILLSDGRRYICKGCARSKQFLSQRN